LNEDQGYLNYYPIFFREGGRPKPVFEKGSTGCHIKGIPTTAVPRQEHEMLALKRA